ncbi:hypothetical protein VTK56DRAFT_9331 [Thermocarpiscus australiensis]
MEAWFRVNCDPKARRQDGERWVLFCPPHNPLVGHRLLISASLTRASDATEQGDNSCCSGTPTTSAGSTLSAFKWTWVPAGNHGTLAQSRLVLTRRARPRPLTSIAAAVTRTENSGRPVLVRLFTSDATGSSRPELWTAEKHNAERLQTVDRRGCNNFPQARLLAHTYTRLG